MPDTSITIFEKSSGPLSKHIAIGPDGRPASDALQCRMWEGTAKRAIANTARELAEVVGTCTSRQGLALGYLRDDIPDDVLLVTKRELDRHPNAIARTRDFIFYRSGVPAWVLIDFDAKGMPPEIAALIREAGGLWALLCQYVPGLAAAAHVVRASTSAGLYNAETGAAMPGSDGLHIYILIADGADAQRLLYNLHDRLWLAGFGWHVTGKAGQLLERSPIDRAVALPEGLKFEGAPVLEPPLGQDAEKRRPVAYEGAAIDSVTVAPPLNAYDQARVKELKDASGKELKNDAAIVRRKYDNTHAEEICKNHGLPIETARRLVAQCRMGFLYPYQVLNFDDVGTKTVADVLADPESYIGCTLADPLEGIGYGRCKAMVMRGDDGTLFIHSFAHGLSLYRLRHDLRNATIVFRNSPTVDRAVEIMASTNFEADEREQFRNEVAAATGLKVSLIARRFKDAEQRREQERRRAAAEAAAASDGRIARPCPPANGALQAEIEFLDATFAANMSAVPPMRDYNGKLIEVILRAPFDLHTLAPEGEEKAEPPTEHTISALTPTGIELLVEQHVRYMIEAKTHSYPASLPRPFITGLNEYRNSALPILKVVNSSPLITASGEIIDGEGLDRETGIFHHIDARLRSCLPTDTPTDDDVRRAVDFLLNEWLVDVALDDTGKFVVIMLALSLIERSLLPERPAFFIVAGLRGSGKTTLAHMVAMAVLGHEAPATSWSDIDEERKKALFSLLRQGVPFVVWDNIRRGEAVSCPHIEASLTSPQIADRILGVSQTDTVSTAAIQVFNGNQITPKGDMSSRSLMIALDADHPNPEDRDFVHPAWLDWTRSNRFKIMGALYTILIAGARNRQPNEIAKTRFKTWWRLVGWPVEYAAKLVGQDLDCDQLIKVSETVDPDVLAIAAVLSTFRAIWGTNRFTARDIVQKLPGEYYISKSPDGRRGEELFDALSELLGKTLSRPTARSMAKLLRRRLIGHPVWLDDNVMATLRVVPDHDANEYWVEVTSPKSASTTSRTASNNPANPANPANPDGNAGIGGIDGIVSPSQGTTQRKSWRRAPGVDLSDPAVREKFAQVLCRARDTDLEGGRHSFPVGSAPVGAGGARACQIDCGSPVALESVGVDPRLLARLEQHVRHLHFVVDPEAATALVQGLAGKTVGFDIETARASAHPAAGLDPRVSSIRLAQFCDPEGQVVYVVDCHRAGTGWAAHLPAVHLVIHNAAFEVRHLMQHSTARLSFDCTMLAGRVLYGENRSLKKLVKEIAGIEMAKDLQTSDWSQEVLAEEQICYAAVDAVAALIIWRELDGMLQGKYRSAYNLLKSLVYPVARQSGVRLDTAAHASLIARWGTEIEEARRELAAAGLANPNSARQRQQYLERVLPVELLVDWKLTPTGQLATDRDTLLMAEHVPTARTLATHRRLSSTHANFGPKLRELLIEGHLYPNFKIGGAVTGRFACSSPNIQNIPRDGFKCLLLPPPGKVFIGGDLNQIELRAAGQISGEEVIDQVFREGRDLHRMMAANITGKPEPEITKEERRMAKAVNFGLLYGAGALALQAYAAKRYRVTMDLAQAKEVKAIFHETYPTLTEWQREIVSETNARGYSESRHVRLTRHYDRAVYTKAMNFPIQSSAWEVLALAIVYVDQNALEDVTISHHVHDELVLAAPPDQADAATRLLEQAFLHGFTTVFPEAPTNGLVEISQGNTWAALKTS